MKLGTQSVEHVVINVPEPSRSPDYETYSWKYWFKEMATMNKKSDGRWDSPYKLGICPETDYLIYLAPYFSVAWHMVADINANEAYQKFLVIEVEIALKLEEVDE